VTVAPGLEPPEQTVDRAGVLHHGEGEMLVKFFRKVSSIQPREKA